MAILIKPNGTKTNATPNNNIDFQLEELYQLIECDMVQMIRLADGRTMWMDEGAKLHVPPPRPNLEATKLLIKAGGISGDIVLGNVLICSDGEVL